MGDRLADWRRTAALDARTGAPVGDALLNACDEIEALTLRVAALEQENAHLRGEPS